MRTVRCDHVGQTVLMPGSNDGTTMQVPAVEPYPRSKVTLGQVTMLLSLVLCADCSGIAHSGGQVIVGPEHGDATTPRMAVYAADEREIQARKAGRRPTATPQPATPQNVSTVRTIAGHKVTLFAEPRLQERETAAWSRRYAAGEVTAAAFRRILAAIAEGPVRATGRRPNLAAADIPADPPIPMDAPMKRETKVRLMWNPRIGFYDGNNPPVSKTMKAAMKGKRK